MAGDQRRPWVHPPGNSSPPRSPRARSASPRRVTSPPAAPTTPTRGIAAAAPDATQTPSPASVSRMLVRQAEFLAAERRKDLQYYKGLVSAKADVTNELNKVQSAKEAASDIQAKTAAARRELEALKNQLALEKAKGSGEPFDDSGFTPTPVHPSVEATLASCRAYAPSANRTVSPRRMQVSPPELPTPAAPAAAPRGSPPRSDASRTPASLDRSRSVPLPLVAHASGTRPAANPASAAASASSLVATPSAVPYPASNTSASRASLPTAGAADARGTLPSTAPVRGARDGDLATVVEHMVSKGVREAHDALKETREEVQQLKAELHSREKQWAQEDMRRRSEETDRPAHDTSHLELVLAKAEAESARHQVEDLQKQLSKEKKRRASTKSESPSRPPSIAQASTATPPPAPSSSKRKGAEAAAQARRELRQGGAVKRAPSVASSTPARTPSQPPSVVSTTGGAKGKPVVDAPPAPAPADPMASLEVVMARSENETLKRELDDAKYELVKAQQALKARETQASLGGLEEGQLQALLSDVTGLSGELENSRAIALQALQERDMEREIRHAAERQVQSAATILNNLVQANEELQQACQEQKDAAHLERERHNAEAASMTDDIKRLNAAIDVLVAEKNASIQALSQVPDPSPYAAALPALDAPVAPTAHLKMLLIDDRVDDYHRRRVLDYEMQCQKLRNLLDAETTRRLEAEDRLSKLRESEWRAGIPAPAPVLPQGGAGNTAAATPYDTFVSLCGESRSASALGRAELSPLVSGLPGLKGQHARDMSPPPRIAPSEERQGADPLPPPVPSSDGGGAAPPLGLPPRAPSLPQSVAHPTASIAATSTVTPNTPHDASAAAAFAQHAPFLAAALRGALVDEQQRRLAAEYRELQAQHQQDTVHEALRKSYAEEQALRVCLQEEVARLTKRAARAAGETAVDMDDGDADTLSLLKRQVQEERAARIAAADELQALQGARREHGEGPREAARADAADLQRLHHRQLEVLHFALFEEQRAREAAERLVRRWESALDTYRPPPVPGIENSTVSDLDAAAAHADGGVWWKAALEVQRSAVRDEQGRRVAAEDELRRLRALSLAQLEASLRTQLIDSTEARVEEAYLSSLQGAFDAMKARCGVLEEVLRRHEVPVPSPRSLRGTPRATPRLAAGMLPAAGAGERAAPTAPQPGKGGHLSPPGPDEPRFPQGGPQDPPADPHALHAAMLAEQHARDAAVYPLGPEHLAAAAATEYHSVHRGAFVDPLDPYAPPAVAAHPGVPLPPPLGAFGEPPVPVAAPSLADTLAAQQAETLLELERRSHEQTRVALGAAMDYLRGLPADADLPEELRNFLGRPVPAPASVSRDPSASAQPSSHLSAAGDRPCIAEEFLSQPRSTGAQEPSKAIESMTKALLEIEKGRQAAEAEARELRERVAELSRAGEAAEQALAMERTVNEGLESRLDASNDELGRLLTAVKAGPSAPAPVELQSRSGSPLQLRREASEGGGEDAEEALRAAMMEQQKLIEELKRTNDTLAGALRKEQSQRTVLEGEVAQHKEFANLTNSPRSQMASHVLRQRLRESETANTLLKKQVEELSSKIPPPTLAALSRRSSSNLQPLVRKTLSDLPPARDSEDASPAPPPGYPGGGDDAAGADDALSPPTRSASASPPRADRGRSRTATPGDKRGARSASPAYTLKDRQTLEDAKRRLEDALAQRDKDLQSERTRIRTLQDRLKECRLDSKRSAEERRSLENEVAALEKELASTRADLRRYKDTNCSVSDWRKSVNEKSEKIAALEEKVLHLTADLRKAKKMTRAAKDEAAMFLKERNAAFEETSLVENALQHAMSTMKTDRDRVLTLENQIIEAETSKQQAEEDMHVLKSALNGAHEAMDLSEAHLHDARAEIAAPLPTSPPPPSEASPIPAPFNRIVSPMRDRSQPLAGTGSRSRSHVAAHTSPVRLPQPPGGAQHVVFEDAHTQEVLAFSVSDWLPGALQYTSNGHARPPTRRLAYDAARGRLRCIDTGRHVDLPVETRPELVAQLFCLAELAGVPHNFPGGGVESIPRGGSPLFDDVVDMTPVASVPDMSVRGESRDISPSPPP